MSKEIDFYRSDSKFWRDRYDAQVILCDAYKDALKLSKKERDILHSKIAHVQWCLIPNGVLSRIISCLPDPNAVGNKSELRIDNKFVITGDFNKIEDEKMRWWFDVKFSRLIKVSDEKIELEVLLKNRLGCFNLRIPATIENLNNGQLRTWVWNIYESGVMAVTDYIYSVIYKADEAWCDVKRDLGL